MLPHGRSVGDTAPRAAVAARRHAVPVLGLWLGVAVTLAGIWRWAASTARMHWDEPSYLYAAAYVGVPKLLSGGFEPSGIEGFSTSRIGHILLLKVLMRILGPGTASLRVIAAVYVVILAGFILVTHRILRILMPGSRYAGVSVALTALAPVVVYLAFKTLAEIPAVLLASLAALAFLRALQGRAAIRLGLVACALVGVAITKNHLVVLPASMVAALLLCGGLGWPVRRIVGHALISGATALAVFFALLHVLGIPLDRYLGLTHWMSGLAEPFVMRPFELALECGPFLLALPLAFLAPGRPARFFAWWFVLATLPLMFSTHVETRYLVGNVVPLTGLIHLSLEGIAPRARRAWEARRLRTATLAAACALALVAFTALSQLVMYYGVRKDEIAALLRRLDGARARDSYAIVTPNEFTTFLFLRVAYPERPVHTVFTAAPPNHRDSATWPGRQRTYFGPHAVQTFEELTALGNDVVYLGTDSDLNVTDFRALLARVPVPALRRAADDLLAAMHPFNPFVLSWMWNDPRVRLTEEARIGHYRAMRVTRSAALVGPCATGRGARGVRGRPSTLGTASAGLQVGPTIRFQSPQSYLP